MNKLGTKIFVFVISLGLMIYLSVYFKSNAWAVLSVGILANIIATPLYFIVVEGLYNLKNLGVVWKSQVVYRNKMVRLSISYLYRIKAKDKYLLVKNRKWNFYQPVGGAFKTLPGAEKVFHRYEVKPDQYFETDHGIAKNDLRFRVPGKNVLPMISWFKSREDRETSPWREFCEELLTTNVLPKHEFRYIDHKYITTVQTPMRKAPKLNCQEILIYEIYDLVPNDEQIKALEKLCSQGDTDYIKWADAELIQTLGFDLRTKVQLYEIGPHAKWANNGKWSEE